MVDSTHGTSPQQASAVPSPSSSQPDQTFYTWSTFFSILSGQASNAERQKYFDARDILREESDCKRCEKHRDYLFKYSPTVNFMRSEVSKLGGDLNSSNVQCKRCDTQQSGGFDLNYGILLCANQFRNRGHVEDTMAHEMVHAWDYLRFKVDNNNLRHQACTEIRAATLSGECRFIREFFTRNQWKITQQLQECVRRRATLSVMARPNCKDEAHATRMVNEVWDSCFSDTRPFDEIYR
ncbi:mitochondrial inner membrane protease atp23 [Lepidopterella palustris CBS 459.81]|uniref:Mitochondrial inner membrane protease ATP23 n=1 Tax=Lepidopterella palustris CBS 459.81 TaxID=1314670 RepID=A0A8E2ELH9_9PEZI|nr:mitochondrial inner membrane protease atp23 [Lepidopterella palustris CBS 459.81]